MVLALERRHRSTKPWRETSQRLPVVVESPADLGLGEFGGVGRNHLGERIVRVVDILVAGAEHHPPTVGVHVDGELRNQPALADTGLAGHQCDQRVPGAGQLPLLVEHLTFVVPAEERGGVGEQLQHRRKCRLGGDDIVQRRGSRRRRAAGQLVAVTGPCLAQQCRDVRLDSPFRDVQACGDLGVRKVLADQREHLRLTPRRHAVSRRRSNRRRARPRRSARDRRPPTPAPAPVRRGRGA